MVKKPSYEELEKKFKHLVEKESARGKLRRQLKFLLSAINQSSEGIAVTDLNGNISYVNDTFAKMHGYSPEKLIGKNLSVFHTREQMPSVEAANQQIKETGEFKGEIWHVRRDGTLFPTIMHNSLVRDESGQPIGMIGTLRDMTNIKESEALLWQREQELRMITDNVPALVSYVNTEGCYRFVNRQYEKWFGIPKEEITGKHYKNVLGKDTYDQIKDHVQKVLQGHRVSYETRLPYARGGTRWVEAEYVPDRDPGGKVNGFFALIYDITDRKREEEALKKRTQQLLSLHETSLEIIKPHNVSPLLQKIVERATLLLGGTGGGMYLCNPKKKHVRCVVSYQTPRDFTGITLNYGEGAAGTVAQTGEALIIGNYSEWANRAGVFEQHQPFRSVISTPLISQNEVIGVIHVLENEIWDRFTTDDLNVLNLFADQAVIAIKNSRLLDQIKVQSTELQKKNEELQLEISERKRAQAALKRSEIWARSIFNSLDEAVLVLTPERGLVDLNEAAVRMFGYSREEIPNLPTEILHVDHEHYEVFGKYLKTAFERGKTVNIEFEAKRKNGEIFPTEHTVSALKDERGEALGIVNVIKDISERKRTESALRESEKKYRELVENINDIIFKTDERGFFTYMSPLIQSLGYDPSDLVGKHFKEIICPEDVDFVMNRFKGLMRGDIKPAEYRVFNKSKVSVWIRSSSKPVYENGLFKGIQGVVTIISKEKRLQEQLRHSQRLEAVGTLAGGVAHEFNNILAIIMGNTDLSLMEIPEWNPLRTYLKEIQSASTRARDIVRHILSFARKTPAESKPVQVSVILKEAMKLMRATIPAEIDIREDILCDTEIVSADPTEIHQVVMNLCTNAAHAMAGSEGVLSVSLAPVNLDQESAFQYEDLTPGDYVRLAVEDTGSGIAPEILDRIFEPFFTTKETGKGTGMGLSVVYGIVKKCGGGIKAASEAGKGSLFEVLLPQVEKPERHEREEREGLPTGTERVLFVDDEESITNLVARILARQGYSVEALTDSLEALERFRAEPASYDLVISDMAMPYLAGDNLAQEIMKIRPDIPIILCTGHSERLDETQAKAIGINAFVMKPLSSEELAKTVRKVLDEAKG